MLREKEKVKLVVRGTSTGEEIKTGVVQGSRRKSLIG